MGDYREHLLMLLDSQPELRYGFVAESSGAILVEDGTKTDVEYSSVIDVAMRPESVQTFYEDNVTYEAQDPRLVPRLYAQGRTNGVLARPYDGILVAVFGDMPEDVHKGSPEERAQWIWDYRNRVRDSITSIFPG
jgi:hypothetical protein